MISSLRIADLFAPYLNLTLSPSDFVLQLGAARGAMTEMLAARLGPAGRLMVVEPSRRNVDHIRRHVVPHHPAIRALFHKAPAAKRSLPLKVVESRRSGFGEFDYVNRSRYQLPGYPVDPFVVDEFVAETGDAPNGLVVMMDQGAAEALEGAAATLERGCWVLLTTRAEDFDRAAARLGTTHVALNHLMASGGVLPPQLMQTGLFVPKSAAAGVQFTEDEMERRGAESFIKTSSGYVSRTQVALDEGSYSLALTWSSTTNYLVELLIYSGGSIVVHVIAPALELQKFTRSMLIDVPFTGAFWMHLAYVDPHGEAGLSLSEVVWKRRRHGQDRRGLPSGSAKVTRDLVGELSIFERIINEARDPERMRLLYRSIVPDGHDNAAFEFYAANAFLVDGDLEQASNLAVKAQRDGYNPFWSSRLLCICATEQKDRDAAQRFFDRANAMEPGSTWLTGFQDRINSLPVVERAGCDPAAARRFMIRTEKPVAWDSPDHINPWGTMSSSGNDGFCRKVIKLFAPATPAVLELGCAGGATVRSFVDYGCPSVGIEGSDWCRRNAAHEWPQLPDNLFTSDITAPFSVAEQGGDPEVPFKFSIIHLWEVIEHIGEDKIAAVMANIDRHLQPGGLVVMSIASPQDRVRGIDLHQTTRDLDWWMDQLEGMGFANQPDVEAFFGYDLVRGPMQGEGSGHVFLTRINEPRKFDLPARNS